MFESLTIILTKNIVLSSFVSFVVVWRLINFGYLVSNTLNFLVAIIATTLIIFLLPFNMVFNIFFLVELCPDKLIIKSIFQNKFNNL